VLCGCFDLHLIVKNYKKGEDGRAPLMYDVIVYFKHCRAKLLDITELPSDYWYFIVLYLCEFI